MFGSFVYSLCWAMSASLVTSRVSPFDLTVRNVPGASTAKTMQAIGRSLTAANIIARDTPLKNSTSIAKNWDGAILFSYQDSEAIHKGPGNGSVTAGVEIKCTTCYVLGNVTAQLKVDGNFNASQAFHSLMNGTEAEVVNITTEAWDYFEDEFKIAAKNISDDDLDISAFTPPTMHYDFDINMEGLPQCLLEVQFDGLELYMLLDTQINLGATYTVNLFSSNSPIGIAVQDLDMGIWVSIDLIFKTDAKIDISSGFHIKLDDGATLNIPMFDKAVSQMTLPGGHFEFLPVTIESAGAVLSATLRIGAHAGVDIEIPDHMPDVTIFNHSLPKLSAGIGVSVFANVAEFVTNVTDAPSDNGCELRVVEEYTLALGAAAGATFAVNSHTWGPAPSTTIPVFYTTMTSACAMKGTSTSTPAAITPRKVLEQRDATTTTITTEQTYTGVTCASSGLVNCPVSLQTTTQYTSTLTSIITVPSGVKATFPTSIQNTVSRTIAFGSSVQKLVAMTGAPSSYVPTSSPTSVHNGGVDGETGGVSNKIIIGVVVGVGVPVLVGLLVCCVFCFRRKKVTLNNIHYRSVSNPATPATLGTPGTPGTTGYFEKKMTHSVHVNEVGRRSS